MINKYAIILFLGGLLIGTLHWLSFVLPPPHLARPTGIYEAKVLLGFAVGMLPLGWFLLRRYENLHLATAPEKMKILKRGMVFFSCLILFILIVLAYSNWSPTTYAMRNSDTVANLLIRSEIAINKRDIDGLTPLGFAIEMGDAGKVKLLLSHGADINLPVILMAPRVVMHYKPLKLAKIKQNAEIIDMLRQAGAEE